MDYILVMTLSLDTLFVCMAYAAEKIKIPLFSKSILALVGTATLAVSLSLGGLLARLFNYSKIPTYIGCAVLLLIGLQNLCSHLIKRALSRRKSGKKTLRFTSNDISFVLDICVDSTKADRDQSKILSPTEALVLAIPISIDSLFSGLSIAASFRSALILLPFSFMCGLAASMAGALAGKKIGGGKHDLSWISGLILIALAIFKLF